MCDLFNTHKYILNEEINVYHDENYKSIDYSDGDNIEQNIYEIISKASNVSVLSDELRNHCVDWPTVYHLGSERANILRPFESELKGVSVLEIGAGCGAITRFLGETGANVLALEGSLRRAKIARSRTRDLDNVTVLAEKFCDFDTEKKFDIITLIGVLEYANLFTSSETPTKTMLDDVRKYLKPNGKLIIAIENQLGLKYFAGAPEDHKWQIMYGIEGRYTKKDPETFGKHQLQKILKSAKFQKQFFYAPFPDYKTANSIVSESAYDNPSFKPESFAIENTLKDHQLPQHLLFSQEKTWKVVHNNNLGLELANSFLIVAYADENEKNITNPSVLAYHYSTSRHAKFCKETKFVSYAEGKTKVITNRLSTVFNNEEKHINLINHIKNDEDYIIGFSVNDKISSIVSKDYWELDDLFSLLKEYLVYVYTLKDHDGTEFEPSWLANTISGSLIDYIPQNIIISGENHSEWNVIDQEWTYDGQVTLSWLLFRTLLIIVQSNSRLGYNEKIDGLTRHQFFDLCFKSLGYDVSQEEFENFALFEAELQSLVTGRDKQDLLNWYSSQVLRTRGFVDEALHMRYLGEKSKEKIFKYDQKLSEMELRINSLSLENTTLACEVNNRKLNEQLLKSSISWRVTAPLRSIRGLMRIPREGKVFNWLRQKRDTTSYISTRVQNGIKRHGMVKAIPMAIKTALHLSSNYYMKIRMSKLYEQRLSELEILISNESNYIDLFHVPMGWNTPLFQRFQHLSLQSSRLGGLALYGGHTQVDKDLFVYEKVDSNVIVFDALDAHVNQRIKAALSSNKTAEKVVRIQSIDMATTIEDILEFQRLGFKVVYEYIDEISEEIVGSLPDFVINRHQWTLDNESIYVVATATKLFEEVATHRSKNMLISTNGVDIDHWRITPKGAPKDLEEILQARKTIIGYHGALAKWIDYDLLHKIADVDDFQLLLIGYEHDGSLKESGLTQRENVHFLGSKSYFELPQYAYYYDVGILPFKKYKLTESVSPVKLFEYMALGKPVVTTDLVECCKYASCLLAEATDHDAFIANLKKAVLLKDDKNYKKTLDDEAISNSWHSKTVEYLKLAGVNVNEINVEGKCK